MGMNERTIWISIYRYDNDESNSETNVQTDLRQVLLPSQVTFTELKSMVYSWADIKENDSKVVKLRKYNYCLIPFSALFQGSSAERPFIIEVVRVHQFCPVKKRTLPPGYISALKSKLTDLEKRVISVEHSIPEIATIHIRAVEEAANDLANCVGYLDRRLDELTPTNWKPQINVI